MCQSSLLIGIRRLFGRRLDLLGSQNEPQPFTRKGGHHPALRTLQITCSVGQTGCCYGNGVPKRFFWSLRHDWTKLSSYENLDVAITSVFKKD
jgi:hypothetical protein